MNTEELTQITTAHQNAISRHDQEMAEIRAIFREGNARSEQWKAEHETRMAEHEERMARIEEDLASAAAQQKLNQQAIAQFTAGLEELRILVANYIQGRENL